MKQDNNSTRNADRTFTRSRQEQGFASQAHLDAFYAAYDHAQGCPVCSKVCGTVELHDGLQPVMGRCETARELDRIENEIEKADRKRYPVTHYLLDPISGEGSMGFSVLEDGRVEIFQQTHPDLPFEVDVLDRESARAIYRRARKAGWVAA